MIKAIKGFNDILPDQSAKWLHLEAILADVLGRYGYEHIRLPIVEQTDLFARAIGGATDIVEKEMYSFTDKSEPPTPLALRPEGTAGAVRAVIEHNLLRGDTPKLWYIGPMFRYERPQKGRYRQFHQLGVESFGSALPDADAELIAMTHLMWQELGLNNEMRLQLNSLGELDERYAYREALVTYLTDKKDQLDEDSKRRLTTNPLRILDSKEASTQAVLADAPKLADFLGEESVAHFEQVKAYLTALNIDFEINPHLVRGLDYYNKTVFEWVTDKLGSQATVCAGGRYDGLVGQLKSIGTDGSKPVKSEPGVGFAMGLERLLLLIEAVAPISDIPACDVFVVAHPEVYSAGISYAQNLRHSRPDVRVKMASATSLKAQMKKADKSGAALTVIIAQQELDDNTISIKDMQTGEQKTVAQDWLSNKDNFSRR
ncbi:MULTISPECIES: histidine--tRNA ligase [unclassified Psychrobacter]|uniref:histidine--tRNA ligase n=1 Tax=unclassified Psychrobacter TaxID=196806 RepID=UPI000C33D71E|nr:MULTISPECIES: histidine--tRNA ligase [unclassified Psychrobacter]MBA6245134.1 histidine--tRNA ligase [Psychrobacter sp. Urea-trap-18]MBA6286737.1 histidine--tRNA ligase [Psychrobacter sp. Urea-trap-16]MBA6317804.1 histidine--tRNA ligase [Psychrobacter sp. Urea-trap-20]MBA6334461.1 histidine--tRNA ligase [Psychrobacter sp. Urea-trap-19]PKG59645.1 histidine--tRNA ligase [Psychrobacter sp. Choline-3u-12]